MGILYWKYYQNQETPKIHKGKKDEIGEIQKKLEDRNKIQNKDTKILEEIKDLKTKIEDEETKDSPACTIICANISKRTLEIIKGQDTSLKIKEKL